MEVRDDGREFFMVRKRVITCVVNAIFAFSLLGLWHLSQTLLEHSKKSLGGISYDRGHVWLQPVNDFLHNHTTIANAVLIITSAHVDIVLVGMALWGIFGKTLRPLLCILFLLIFRECSQFLVSAPIPVGMIWNYPGFPSLIVTYYTSLDFFFSGHTGSATLSVLEIGRRHYKNKILLIVAILLLFMEVFCILSMRFHYTADVITGIFAAATAFQLAVYLSPATDKLLQKFINKIVRDSSPRPYENIP